jgi:hypothetical protein
MSKTIPQPQIEHVIIRKLSHAGSFRAVEAHISRGDLPVVTDPVA